MKKLSFIAAALLLSSTFIVNEASAQGAITSAAAASKPPTDKAINSIDIGAAIPMADAKMKTTDGKEIALNNKLTSEGLLVMFSCNTCPYVVKSQARTKEMMDYAAKKGIGMVVVNSNAAQRDDKDSYKAMVKYANGQKYTAPYVVDENAALADAFGAMRTPEVFLFDGTGKLVYKGAMEDNPSTPAESKEMFLKDAIDNLTAKKPIEPNSTKSIGCTIKRS